MNKQIADDPANASGKPVSAVYQPEVVDYSGTAESIIPVSEVNAVQLQPGPAITNLSIFSSDKVAVMGAQHHAASVGIVVLKPEFMGFMWWSGEASCRINGELASPTRLFMQGTQNGFHATGAARRTMGAAFRRQDMIQTVAALRGVYPEDISLDQYTLELSPGMAARFRSGVNQSLRNSISSGGHADPSETIFGLLVEALLSSWDGPNHARRVLNPERVVRQAEEAFFAATDGQVSLADLCRATHTSKSSLYRAFDAVCGESPLAYFHKRRLTSARRALLGSTPYRGAIRQTALSNGFTEFGRFSVEYRNLFGESPSTTLSRSSRS